MLHAHLDLITTADPLALPGCIRYIENQVRPEIESQPGSLGLSLLASPEHGVAVCESLWSPQVVLRPIAGECAGGDGPDGMIRKRSLEDADRPGDHTPA